MRAKALLAVSAALLLGSPASAQTRVVPQSEPEIRLSLAPLAKSVSGAVVNVLGVTDEVPEENAYKAAFYRRYFPGDPGRPMARSLGSGVMLDPSGLVVTNDHVIEALAEIRIGLADGREFKGELVLRDPRLDLAILKVEGPGPFPTLEIADSEDLAVGDLVLAVGYPMGLAQTVTQGIVSGLARTGVAPSDAQSFIQTDAAINPGNSGGALVDVRGRLLGINTAIFSLSGGSDGVGFATPSNLVRIALEAARDGDSLVRRPWLGARLQPLTEATSSGLPAGSGARVRSVVPKSPAAEAGLRVGDVIVEVDGRTIDGPEAFKYRLWLKGIEGSVPLLVVRAGEKRILDLPLAEAPETRPREPVVLGGRSPLAGVTAANLSPAVADELGVRAVAEAAILTSVDRKSAAGRLGFRRGDVVVAVDGQAVRGSRDLERVLGQRAGRRIITLQREGRTFSRAYAREKATALATAD